MDCGIALIYGASPHRLAEQKPIEYFASHPQRFAECAGSLGLEVEIRRFDATTRTAEDAADAIGCSVGQIVKSLVFLVDGEAVMTLVSGANRLDEKKLAALCGVGRKKVERADAGKVREVTGYSIGGVPTFAHTSMLRTFIDEDFFQYDTIWAAGGTSNAVFAIAPEALVRVSEGETVTLKTAA